MSLKNKKRSYRRLNVKSFLNSKRYELFTVKTNLNMDCFLYDTKNKKCIAGSSTKSKDFILHCNANSDVNRFLLFGKFFRKIVDSYDINVSDVYLNRGFYLFHGKLKFFCDGFFV